MPHDMFRDVTRPPARLGSQATYTVPLSILSHAAVVVILVIVPIIATDDTLQIPSSITAMVAPPAMPEPPPPPYTPTARSVTSEAATTVPDRSSAPSTPPESIAEDTGPPAQPGIPVIGVATGGPDISGIGGVPGGTGISIPGPPPTPAPTGPIHPGGKVKYPEKVRDVRPVYPPLAISGRVEGRVIIEAIIAVDGRVKDARILRSIPLLDRAALEAVNQWVFSPTLLNGVPVPVIITVSVDFKLR